MYHNGNIYNTNPATVRYSVSDYLEVMHKKYTEDYRKEWEKLDKQYKAEEERWKQEIRRGWTDGGMKAEDFDKHNEKMRNIKKGFAELGQRAKAELSDILAEADTRFERYARPTGDKVDLATVELLKSDILADEDIFRLASDFKGNVAMTRIIGKYADERAKSSLNSNSSAPLRALAVECKKDHFNYREPLEAYIDIAVPALSTDETTSFAYNKVLNEGYSKKYENAKELYVSTEYEGGENANA